jgi:H+/gluconate symporter-like permease
MTALPHNRAIEVNENTRASMPVKMIWGAIIAVVVCAITLTTAFSRVKNDTAANTKDIASLTSAVADLAKLQTDIALTRLDASRNYESTRDQLTDIKRRLEVLERRP